MTAIAPHISDFLQERLPAQIGASSNTCDSYAYAFQLLFEFAAFKIPCGSCELNLSKSTRH